MHGAADLVLLLVKIVEHHGVAGAVEKLLKPLDDGGKQLVFPALDQHEDTLVFLLLQIFGVFISLKAEAFDCGGNFLPRLFTDIGMVVEDA